MSNITILFKALSDQSRLRILKCLEFRRLCVCEITEIIGLATPTVSSHLAMLKSAGLIEDEKEGKWVNYGLKKNPDPFVAEIWRLVSAKLSDEELVKRDREKLLSVNRYAICARAQMSL